MSYRVDTIGRVYHPNTQFFGVVGSIGGLTREHVISQIKHHQNRGQGLQIFDEQTGMQVPKDTFVENVCPKGWDKI